MVFTRFVQNGRVALVNYGEHQGKLVVIVDVVNHNEALVYGPTSGVARQLLSYKRMQLTDIVLDISRGQRKKNVDAAWAKAAMGDFDRFKAMVAKKEVNAKARKAVA